MVFKFQFFLIRVGFQLNILSEIKGIKTAGHDLKFFEKQQIHFDKIFTNFT